MLPSLQPGRLIVATGWFGYLGPGDRVIVLHAGREIIKRVSKRRDNQLYILGDNTSHSTDSRSFGWVDHSSVIGTVLY